MCRHKLVAEQVWVLMQARPQMLAETLCRKMAKMVKKEEMLS